MKRCGFAAVVLGALLFAPALDGATPGYTTAERSRAIELQKRLTAKKVPDKLALEYARTYLRRAYLVDWEPAEAIAGALLRADRRIPDADEIRYFAAVLDALGRGARLVDVNSALNSILDSSYSTADKGFYIESLMQGASVYVSPKPLVEMAHTMAENGLVGRRLHDQMAWAFEQVAHGEDPDCIKQIYDAYRKVTPSLGAQREFLAKCFAAIRKGAPARGVVNLAVALSKKYESAKLVDEGVDKVIQSYQSGTAFDEAVATIFPPEKKVL